MVTHDIIGSINDNVAAGNMTIVEGEKLAEAEKQLEHAEQLADLRA